MLNRRDLRKRSASMRPCRASEIYLLRLIGQAFSITCLSTVSAATISSYEAIFWQHTWYVKLLRRCLSRVVKARRNILGSVWCDLDIDRCHDAFINSKYISDADVSEIKCALGGGLVATRLAAAKLACLTIVIIICLGIYLQIIYGSFPQHTISYPIDDYVHLSLLLCLCICGQTISNIWAELTRQVNAALCTRFA